MNKDDAKKYIEEVLRDHRITLHQLGGWLGAGGGRTNKAQKSRNMLNSGRTADYKLIIEALEKNADIKIEFDGNIISDSTFNGTTNIGNHRAPTDVFSSAMKLSKEEKAKLIKHLQIDLEE